MLHEYVPKAIEELENYSKAPDLVDKQYDDFDILVDLIADESKIEPRDIGITEAAYRDQIESIINNISNSENPVGDFHAELNNLEEALSS